MSLAGCAGPAPTPTPQPTATGTAGPPATVSLGLYSGRPDPSWTLTAAQTAELLDRVSTLPPGTGEPPTGGLGYHGFAITLGAPGSVGASLAAYHGAITDPEETDGSWRRDATGSVERWLLETGRSSLTPDEVSIVTGDLDVFFGPAASSPPPG